MNRSGPVRIRNAIKITIYRIFLDDGRTWSETLVVPVEGIEPPLLAEHDFESCASTSSATRAWGANCKARSNCRPVVFVEHDLFGKPATTFPGSCSQAVSISSAARGSAKENQTVAARRRRVPGLHPPPDRQSAAAAQAAVA